MSKRILLSSEYSKLGTGYGNCFKNLAIQLQKRGFEVIEYASYCFADDKSRFASDWEIIPAGPDRNDKKAMEIYNKNTANQFGALFFDEVIAMKKPDIVIDWRDPWYMVHVLFSPARKFYKTIIIPTIDSRPQRPEWLYLFSKADSLNTMSYFGRQTVQEEFDLKPNKVITIGVDESFRKMYENFKGQNKDVFRKKYGLPTTGKIFTFVSRNQRRKLFADVMHCADKLIDEGLDIYIHFHTSYPDNVGGSWEFPIYLSRMNNPDRFLFTYICHRCKHVMIRTFADAITECPKCHGPMFMPSPQYGFVDRDIQKEIMYAADFGINPAIGGGLEMSISEMKALGNPVISTSWAAMDEQGYRDNGDIPPYQYLSYNGQIDKPYLGGKNCEVYLWFEIESGQLRAFMNRQSFMDIMKEYYYLKPNQLQQLQRDAYNCAKYFYNWNVTGDKFAEIINTMPSSQHLYKYLPGVKLDTKAIINKVRSLPPNMQIYTWYNHIREYMEIEPHLLQKANADLVNLNRFGLSVPMKNVPTFTKVDDAYNFMVYHTEKVNKFYEMRQKYV